MKFDTAVIFAGGKSSRMKRDKALLPFGGYRTLTEYQYRKLSKIFNRVYISTKSDKFDFKANMIFDNSTIFSPLVGIISIFETLNLDEVFIISVDIPFINSNIIEKLYSNNSIESDIVVAKSKNGIEPLCGIYKRDVLDVAKINLKNGTHKLKILLNSLNTKIVDFNLDSEFLNLNTPQTYFKSLNEII
jgi:molybdopterin-guanine dinucleotide biosynthesis protein A